MVKIYYTKDVEDIVKNEFYEEVRDAYINYDDEHDNQKAFIAAIGSLVIMANRIIRKLGEEEEAAANDK